MSKKAAAAIRDRVVELVRVRAGDLQPHPLNAREHPEAQSSAVRLMLESIGMADRLLAYRTSEGLRLIDGHLRRELAPDSIVPVLVTDLSEEEAATLLAVGDPLAGMAETNRAVLEELLQHGNEDLLEQLRGSSMAMEQFFQIEAVPGFEPVGEDEQGQLDERGKVICPECGHQFTP